MISSNLLSSFICHQCHADLKICVKFKKKFENSQTFLECISSSNLPEEDNNETLPDPVWVELPLPDEEPAIIKLEPPMWLTYEHEHKEVIDSDCNLPCYQCSEMFTSEAEVIKHAREHHKQILRSKNDVQNIHESKIRNQTFPDLTNLPANLDLNDYEFRKFKCQLCNKSYFTQTQLRVHIKDCHSLNLNIACPIKGCKKKFRNAKRLANHQRYKHKDKQQREEAAKQTPN